MIFSNSDRQKGRLTAAEREKHKLAAETLGIDTSKSVSEGDAVMLVLESIASESPENRKHINRVLEEVEKNK